MGTMYWQLNDSWPVVSWSSRDYYGKKKALQYALPDVFSNILISPVLEDGHVRVYISSDEYLPIVGIMTVKLMDFEGNMYADEGFSIEIPGNTSLVYYDTLQANYLGKLKPEEVLCLVTFNGGMYGGKHKRLLYFVPPKDLSLPVPVISKRVTPSKDGYTIETSSDKLARNVFITTTIKGDFSNNYFDLLPGESVEVQFKTSKKVARMEDQIVVKSLVDSYQ
jgi:beta-mannosidase